MIITFYFNYLTACVCFCDSQYVMLSYWLGVLLQRVCSCCFAKVFFYSLLCCHNSKHQAFNVGMGMTLKCEKPVRWLGNFQPYTFKLGEVLPKLLLQLPLFPLLEFLLCSFKTPDVSFLSIILCPWSRFIHIRN